MNKKLLLSGILGIFLTASFSLHGANNDAKSKANETPEEINKIIKKSCFGCHNADSQNDKAKDKLDFKKFESLSNPDKIHALREIGEVVEEGDMPPKKFLERYPDKALTADEKEALMDWAKKEAINLMK